MYTVVLVDKEDHEVIGDIGNYSKFNEAEYKANDYNRKGDRHNHVKNLSGINLTHHRRSHSFC